MIWLYYEAIQIHFSLVSDFRCMKMADTEKFNGEVLEEHFESLHYETGLMQPSDCFVRKLDDSF